MYANLVRRNPIEKRLEKRACIEALWWVYVSQHEHGSSFKNVYMFMLDSLKILQFYKCCIERSFFDRESFIYAPNVTIEACIMRAALDYLRRKYQYGYGKLTVPKRKTRIY